jgi:transcription antitermination factor NusG
MNTPPHLAINVPTGIDVAPKHFDARWYAVYTRSRHEKRVLEQLQVKSIECFLPVHNVMSHWKDRDTCVQLPLFPGYVFVRIALQNRMAVLQAPGVVRLIGQDNKPESLPEMEIEALRTAMTQKIPVAPHPYLKAGESVVITNGPFEGLEGVLLRMNRLRVVLSLSQIHASFVLDVDALDVQPIRPLPTNGRLWQPQWRQISSTTLSDHGVVTRR